MQLITKIALIFLLMPTIVFAQKSQWNKNDTLQFYDNTLETSDNIYFLPNGKYLYYGDRGGLDYREYGKWEHKGDSVHVNIIFVHNYANIESVEEKIDTNFYRCYPLNSNKVPSTGLDGPKTKYFDFPKDVFFDKLK